MGDFGEDDGVAVALAPRVRLRVLFARFWPATRSVRGCFALILLLVPLGPALAAAGTWLFKIMIDTVVVPGDLRAFPGLGAVFVGLGLAQGLVAFTGHYLSVWTGERFLVSLRTQLFAHLHRLAPEFLQRRSLGDVLARLTGDVAAIEALLLSGLTQAVTYLFELVFFVAALVLLDWRLAGAALVGAPGFLLLARAFSRRIQNASRERGRRAGALSGIAEESLSNATLVRAYHHAETEHAKFAEQLRAGLSAQMAATRLEALFAPLSGLLEVIGVLVVIGLAVWELGHHRITIGGLLAFVAYLTQLYAPIQSIGALINELFAAGASAERVVELLDQQPTIVEPAHPRALGRARGALRFAEVCFTYPCGEHTILSGVDFTALPGQRIAVVGASGAGKSTIAKLLLRFYDPDAGSIAVDGVDLRELSLEDLSRNIATVLQETLVFDGTIRENIRWGRPAASERDIIDAAVAADAHEFISQLPLGYDTPVGHRGGGLSGGQRQRVAIARAMIRDAPVLILDEPTRDLDSQSAQRVLVALRRLMIGRTTIIISHDLWAVTTADQILLLEQGRLTARGTHRALLTTSAGYARLFTPSQARDQHAPLVPSAEVFLS